MNNRRNKKGNKIKAKAYMFDTNAKGASFQYSLVKVAKK